MSYTHKFLGCSIYSWLLVMQKGMQRGMRMQPHLPKFPNEAVRPRGSKLPHSPEYLQRLEALCKCKYCPRFAQQNSSSRRNSSHRQKSPPHITHLSLSCFQGPTSWKEHGNRNESLKLWSAGATLSQNYHKMWTKKVPNSSPFTKCPNLPTNCFLWAYLVFLTMAMIKSLWVKNTGYRTNLIDKLDLLLKNSKNVET